VSVVPNSDGGGRELTTAERYLKTLWGEGSVLLRTEPFTLKSGRVSYVYVNHRNMICLPRNLVLFGEGVVEVSRRRWSDTFAIATVDSSVSPYLVAASSILGDLPSYNLRLVSREKGLSDEVFAYDENASTSPGRRRHAVLIDDVVTTTSTLDLARSTLAEHGIAVLGAACLLDRRVASEKARSTIEVVAVSTLEEALHYGLDHGALSEEQLRLVDIELQALGN
jgi:orotate phosphoribosyltransferase